MKEYFWICSVALLSVAAARVAGEPLPVNTWVKAEIDAKATLAATNIPGASWSFSDGYSDNSFRARSGGVLIRTGIHSRPAGLTPGFYTNTTVEWDLTNNTAKIWEIARWNGGSYGGANPWPSHREYPTPNPRHTYDGICYVPEEDAMYMLFGAYFRSKGQGASDEGKALIDAEANNTWRFSFAERRWSRIASSPKSIGLPIRSLYEAHLAHWPEEKKLLFFDSGGGNGAEFDLATREWKAAPATNKPGMSLYHARSTWDSKRGLWVFRKGPNLCTFDPRTRTFASLPDCWALEIAPEDKGRPQADKPSDKRLNWKGVCYVAKHDAYLVTGPTGNDTMVYHVAEGRWRSVKAGALELPNGYCQYNPELDLVAMNIHFEAFTFRYLPEK